MQKLNIIFVKSINAIKYCIIKSIEPIVKNPLSTLLLSICMVLPYIIYVIKNEKWIDDSIYYSIYTLKVFYYSFAIIYILLLITCLLNRINHSISRLFLFVSWVAVLTLTIPALFLRVCFNTVYTSYHLQLLYETNPDESSEFISTYLLTAECGYMFLLLIVLYAISYFLCHVVKSKWHDIPKILKSITTVIVSLFCISSVAYMVYNIDYFSYSNFSTVEDSKCLRKTTFHQLVTAYWQYKSHKDENVKCIESQKQNVVDLCSYVSPNIVLIIGESFNRHHSSLYGYPLNTNPKLSKREGLYVFSDVISPVAVTHAAFQQFLSCASMDESIKWYDTPLFPKVFRDAGYNVIFYSNQFAFGLNYAVWDAHASFINLKGITDVCFNERNSTKYKYDGDLIKEYQQNRDKIEKDRNNLVIFHLIGQHLQTKERFRPERAVFKILDIYRPDLSDIYKQQIADYDNATLYNDSVVDAIMDTYSDKDAIVIYFADHGDEVNDYRKHLGRSGDFAQNGNKIMHCLMDIPFMIYCTPKYKINHPEIVKRIEASVDNPFMTDDLPHLLFGLAGIHTRWYEEKRDVISEKFDRQRKRIFMKLDPEQYFDYDKYCKKTDPWPNTQIIR